MSKRTLFLIFALFIIAFVLLIMALYKPSSPKPDQTVTAPKESIAQTILSFGELSIATPSSTTNLNYSLPIDITTGKNKVTTVQLELQYDPLILIDVSVVPGSFFKNPQVFLSQIDTKTGRISYAFGINPSAEGMAGNGIVATLTFAVLSRQPLETSILFNPKTKVTAAGINPSVLKGFKSVQFVVGAENATQ